MSARAHTPDITELLRELKPIPEVLEALELQLRLLERALSLWLELLRDVHLEVEGLRWAATRRH